MELKMGCHDDYNQANDDGGRGDSYPYANACKQDYLTKTPTLRQALISGCIKHKHTCTNTYKNVFYAFFYHLDTFHVMLFVQPFYLLGL